MSTADLIQKKNELEKARVEQRDCKKDCRTINTKVRSLALQQSKLEAKIARTKGTHIGEINKIVKEKKNKSAENIQKRFRGKLARSQVQAKKDDADLEKLLKESIETQARLDKKYPKLTTQKKPVDKRRSIDEFGGVSDSVKNLSKKKGEDTEYTGKTYGTPEDIQKVENCKNKKKKSRTRDLKNLEKKKNSMSWEDFDIKKAEILQKYQQYDFSCGETVKVLKEKAQKYIKAFDANKQDETRVRQETLKLMRIEYQNVLAIVNELISHNHQYNQLETLKNSLQDMKKYLTRFVYNEDPYKSTNGKNTPVKNTPVKKSGGGLFSSWFKNPKKKQLQLKF